MNKYGHFSPGGEEYIVTDPHPPRDWFNVFWNEHYLASASQNMNGFSLHQSRQGIVSNLFGRQDERETPRAVYLRDRDSGEYWSAAYHPCPADFTRYTCSHKPGVSTLTTEQQGIEVSHRIFVPRKQPCEVWTLTVTNHSDTPRHLTVFSVLPIALDGLNMPYGYLSGLQAECEKQHHHLFFSNTSRTVVHERYRGFMWASRPFARWDTSRAHFLGKTRNMATPAGVVQGRLSNSPAASELMTGALQHTLTLKPGATWQVHILAGLVYNRAEALRIERQLGTTALIEKELAAVQAGIRKRMGNFQITTPDAAFNHLFSHWLKHEMHLMADWARFYFKGYRDTCQDAAGLSVLDVENAKQLLRKALTHQYQSGFAPRAFRVPGHEVASADKHYADSPSWISLATEAIVQEGGDLSFLDEPVAYEDGIEGSIWEHNLRAMNYLWNDRGAHGLSLIHDGDWNDLMDEVGPAGRGESVWMSMALAAVLQRMARMATWRKDKALTATCRRRHKTLQKALLKHAWEKDRFISVINDEGKRYGLPRAKEGAWFINPQSWSMLSGMISAADYAHIARRMEPVVDTPVGPVHNWPPFTKFDPGMGQLSGTPAGFYTNGNVYCHAAAFKIMADYEAGRADKAFDTLMRILPSEDKSEPYAQANGYVGPTALRLEHHVSDDPWRTGTVAWLWIIVLKQLIGFKPELDGFHLQPQLPAAWQELSCVRPFRGRTFNIHIQRGTTFSLSINGTPHASSFIKMDALPRGKRPIAMDCTIPNGPQPLS